MKKKQKGQPVKEVGVFQNNNSPLETGEVIVQTETAVDLNSTPDESWSLQQIEHYCRQLQSRMSLDAWRLGWALVYAKAKQLPGHWMDWLDSHCPNLSPATASRYMKLARSFTPDQLDGVALTAAYHMMGVHTRAKPKLELPAPGQGTLIRLTGSGEIGENKRVEPEPLLDTSSVSENEPPVASPSQSNADVEFDIEEDDEIEGSIQEEIEDVLPGSVQFLRRTIGTIMDAEVSLRTASWAKMNLISLAAEITALRNDLDRLEADIAQLAKV